MENDLLFIKQQLAEKEKQVQEYQKQAQTSGKWCILWANTFMYLMNQKKLIEQRMKRLKIWKLLYTREMKSCLVREKKAFKKIILKQILRKS